MWIDEVWLWSIGGMILPRKSRSTQRKTCPITALSTTYPLWVVLRLNLGLHVKSPTTDCLSHAVAHSFVCVYEVRQK